MRRRRAPCKKSSGFIFRRTTTNPAPSPGNCVRRLRLFDTTSPMIRMAALMADTVDDDPNVLLVDLIDEKIRKSFKQYFALHARESLTNRGLALNNDTAWSTADKKSAPRTWR